MQDYISPWYLKWWGLAAIAVSVIALSLLSAFGFYVLDRINRFKQIEDLSGEKLIENNDLKPAELDGLDLKDNYWIGSADPKVTIIEFADFSCPSCREAFIKFRKLSVERKKDVRLVFVDFPVASGKSTALALAARCAGEQGLFWIFHDKLFLNKDVSGSGEIFALAEQTGADIIRFKDCYESEKYIPQIRQDYQDGQKLKITGTPSWFINGYRVEGDMPEEMFKGLVESLLK